MTSLKQAILVITLCVGGCAVGVEGRFHTDYAFTFLGPAADHPAFTAAVAAWNDCGVVVVTETADGVPVTKVDGFPWDPEMLAVTDINRATRMPISIEYRAHDGLLPTFEHELGHALIGDIHHTTYGLMAPRMSPEISVDAEACALL